MQFSIIQTLLSFFYFLIDYACYVVFSHFAEFVLVLIAFQLILLDLLDKLSPNSYVSIISNHSGICRPCFSGLIVLVGNSRVLLNTKHPAFFQFKKISTSV